MLLAVADRVGRLAELWWPKDGPIAEAVDVHLLVDEASHEAAGDLWAFATRDPAADGNWAYVLESYLCYRAVLTYRLAHAMVLRADIEKVEWATSLKSLARKFSEGAKIRSGVEIHPSASIGPRFVVDHGFGTVIGETVTLGSDCYVLQGVVLGATGISTNQSGKRHPTVGDRVEIGAFARVLGPVTIGDDVVLGPHALVTHDVPGGSRVSVVNRCQVTTRGTALYVSAVIPAGHCRIDVLGIGLDRPDLQPSLLDREHQLLPDPPVHVVDRRPDRLSCHIEGPPFLSTSICLQLRDGHGNSVVLPVPTPVLDAIYAGPSAATAMV